MTTITNHFSPTVFSECSGISFSISLPFGSPRHFMAASPLGALAALDQVRQKR